MDDLIKIAYEVCSGMVYPVGLNYIHRDIAARNVMLTTDLTAKLGDFGLCRKIEEDQSTLISKEGKLPIKHMPYESIKFGEFSEKSDIWSFGILLFEMFSGGQLPFKEIEPEDFIQLLENGGRPTFPEETPNKM